VKAGVNVKIFVITPNRPDPLLTHKQEIIRRVAAKYDLSIFFGFERIGEGNAENSLAILSGSDFVLADLSLERPSCYFEVGFAQALAKPVALMASTGTLIHQVRHRDEVKFFDTLVEYERLVDSTLQRYAQMTQ
jgi:nucleoside 2-deoxyribosyltransferase